MPSTGCAHTRENSTERSGCFSKATQHKRLDSNPGSPPTSITTFPRESVPPSVPARPGIATPALALGFQACPAQLLPLMMLCWLEAGTAKAAGTGFVGRTCFLPLWTPRCDGQPERGAASLRAWRSSAGRLSFPVGKRAGRGQPVGLG